MTSDDSGGPGLLQREIASFTSANAVIDVYRERLAPGGLLGRVVQSSDHVILLEMLSEAYAYDGLCAFRPGDVSRIRAHDRELRSIPELIRHDKSAPLDDVALLELSAAMTMLAKRFTAVSVLAESVDATQAFFGEPEELDDDFLVLRAWGTARSGDDYRLVLRLSDITRVDADTAYLRRLQQLRRVLSAS